MFGFQEEGLALEDDFEGLERAETARTVREAIQELPEHYREVVLCIYFREMGVQETAKELGISEGTVKSRLFRAKERLKQNLGRRLSDG